MSSDVVVANQSSFVRDLLVEVLEPEFGVVGVAETGVEVVELAREHEPAAVVLDLSLPIRSGVDATAAIVESLPGTGVVVCTTEADAKRLGAAREAGATEYVVRPFQRAGLHAAVEAAASG